MDEITIKQEQWLGKLQSISKRPLRVSKSINGKPTRWVSLQDAELPVDYRTVLHNEIVIDIDSEKWKEVRLFAEIICDTLEKLHIPYMGAYSGGRGIHIHVFFDLSSEQKKICVQNDVMPKDLRVWLFEHILENAGISPTLIGPGKPFDTSCVSWSDEGKGHLIRVFGGKKQNYKTLISEVPETKPCKEIVFPDGIVLWHVPDRLFQDFLNQFKRYQKERVETVQRYQKASENFTGQYMSVPCIQKILCGLPEGQRNAGARILAIGSRLDKMSKGEAEKAMLMYSGNCSKENISQKEYQGWIEWIYQEDNLFWNCRFCKELDVCKDDCKFNEAAFKDILNFLEDPDLVSAIDKILGKRIMGDRKNRMLTFLVCLSAYGSSPLNLFLKGESSIGKTHIAKSVAEYFPEEDVWFIGDMSPKALIHEHGEYRDGKVYISLQNKILVFMETPRRETLEMLKPILSHDRTEIEYKIADKRASGQLGTKRVIICGWPATVFCTTDFRYLEELSTRSMLTTPEVTEEKIAQVLKYKGMQYSHPWRNREDETERILKEGIRRLKSRIQVCVPYADGLAEAYERNEPRVMRDFEKLMELIKMSAFLHQEQRVNFEVEGTQEKFVIANEYDYWIGQLLFEAVRETTVTGVPRPVIDFYETIIDGINGTVNYQSMRERFVQVYKRPISRTHLRNKFIEPLESIGWLSRDQDPIDGRKVIFEKCRIEPEKDETMGVYEASHFREIFPEEKLEEYIGELKEIWNKKGVDNRVCDGGDCGYDWFYSGRVPYFLEQNSKIKGETKDENSMKNGSSTNLHNLEEIKVRYEVLENQLINKYDEETVLLQIPQEDTKVEEVVRKFKDQNKVVDTLVILRDKAKVMTGVSDGHAYIRRLKTSGDGNHSADTELSRWTCSMCGIKFHAQIPYEDYYGNAICDDCWKKLTGS